jgi:hypothetical protein
MEQQTVSPPFFMLVQDDVILDCCQNPSALMWSLLDDTEDFSVGVGVINEEGKREVVGTCADFHANPGGTVFYLTSEMDGYRRLVNKAGGSVNSVRQRVCHFFNQGYLSDPCDLTHVDLWEGFVND